MATHRNTRRVTSGALAFAACACILLALAAAAPAHTADNVQRVVHDSTSPTIVKETVVQPDSGGPGTIALVLIGIGAAAALLGAGYLGARIALRTTHVRPS